MVFATPTDLATYLRTATSEEAADGSPDILDTALALQLLDSATGYIQGACHWHIAPVETVTTRMRLSNNVLDLPTMRLTAVGALNIDGSANLIRGRDFDFDETGRVEVFSYLLGGWGRTKYAQITYSHGYAEVPDAVRGVCLEMAAQAYPNPSRHLSETVETTTTVFARPTDFDVRLAPYRRPVGG